MNKRLLPLARRRDGELLIHEVYKSVQGESTFAGLPCVFVRLSACDARCTWCDTPHAFTEGTSWSIERVLHEVTRLECPMVEITGGEPLLQPEVFGLMTTLCDMGHEVLIETSGTRDVSPIDRRVHVIMDIKCPDSGEAPNNRWGNLDALKPTDQIKLVIASREDFDWAVEVVRANRLDERFTVLFSPAFGLVEPVHLVAWLLDSRLRARMQLQLHKYIWPPEARGV
jgi:7-carboxy-7-deazaguanine synthase